jgi:Tfp pilus assembly protein PilN
MLPAFRLPCLIGYISVTTKLNLATKPFSNRALPWVVTAAIIFVSLVSLVIILRATNRANAQAAAVQKDINDLGQQEQALRKQAEAVRQSLTNEQRQTLTAAHALVDRKQFSWSRLFADLEAALPGNVRVKRIAVRGVSTRGSQTLAELELAVVAKSPNVVTDMIAAMDRVGVFRAELRAQNLQRGRGETGSEYELFVIYMPRAGAPAEASSIAAAAPKEPLPREATNE